jgi:branched-chain amino acid transport system ATP-binding protein
MAILETRALTKSVAEREVHAIIGPNGAGKSTMVNLLTGQIAPTGGSVMFEGRNITGMRPERISQIGIGRSFQRTNIFPAFTCLENCRLAAQSRMKHSFRFFRRAERYGACTERAERALDLCGLGHRRDTTAADMSYGEQRQLEIGMVLATEPRFLVLDEPMAGMGKEESGRVVALLRDLARTYPLVLVEHDMDAVFSIADTLTVMVDGTVIASGPLDEVRDSTAVQEAYLGDGEEDY